MKTYFAEEKISQSQITSNHFRGFSTMFFRVNCYKLVV